MAESLDKAPESRWTVLDRALLGLEGRSMDVEGVDGVFDGTDVVDERLEGVLDGPAHLLDGPQRMTDQTAWLIVVFVLVISGSQ